MRILNAHGIDSILSTYDQIPVKEAGRKYASLMKIPRVPPPITPFSQWTGAPPPQQETTSSHQQPRPSSSTPRAPSPPQYDYFPDSDLFDVHTTIPEHENFNDIVLRNQGILASNQRTLNRNLGSFSRSTSTRVTNIEKKLDKVSSTLGKIFRKVRGRSSSSSSSSSPSPAPPSGRNQSSTNKGKFIPEDQAWQYEDEDEDDEEEDVDEGNNDNAPGEYSAPYDAMHGLSISEDSDYDYATWVPPTFDRHRYFSDQHGYDPYYSQDE